MKKIENKKDNYFVDNKEFLNLIIEYQKIGNSMSSRNLSKLGKIILDLVNHYAMRPNFCRYSYLEEMKSNALITIWKGLKSFDPTRSDNPFAYYTSACHRAFIFIITKEAKIFERNKMFGDIDIEKKENLEEYTKIARKKWTRENNNNQTNYS